MKTLFTVLFSTISWLVHAQNVGIGTNNPATKLQVDGSFSIRAPYFNSMASPTPSQRLTMINGNTINLPAADSVGRIYDPGGPSGNYLANLTGYARVSAGTAVFTECLVEAINLGTGDSLIIYDGDDEFDPVLYRVGNGFTTSNVLLTFSTGNAYCRFKSNTDASTGTGFSLFFKKKYLDPTTTEPQKLSGNGILFNQVKGALVAGTLNQEDIGINAVAIGNKNKVPANGSIGLGTGNTISGMYGFAMGVNNIVRGSYAFAIGTVCEAMGSSSTALGYGSRAVGNISTAMGLETVARGMYSVSMGNSTISRSASALTIGQFNDTLATESTTLWQAGDRAFVIGDGTDAQVRSSCFYILKNGNGWMQGTLTQASDARLKTGIVPLTDALPKLLRLNGYNYYWKDKQNMPGLQTGLIAQEVQREMPELVTTNTEAQLAVNYSGMIPYLLQGIKEQQEQIKKLQDEINTLKKMLMEKQ